VWCEVSGAAGRIVPRAPAGPPVLAGTLFSEHTFTRPFGTPEQRRVTRLDTPGYPAQPEMRYAAPAATTAMDAPAGATWVDELAADSEDTPLALDHTDSNQHVNSLVYIRLFLAAVHRRLAAHGRSTRLRTHAIDIGYRKPSFAGEVVRCQVRCFDLAGQPGAAGMVAGADAKPRCYVRVVLGD
jgi:hypothetical protein